MAKTESGALAARPLRALAFVGIGLVMVGAAEDWLLPRLEGSAEPSVLGFAPFTWFPAIDPSWIVGSPGLPVALAIVLLVALGTLYAVGLATSSDLQPGYRTLALVLAVSLALSTVAVIAPPARKSDGFYYAFQGRMIARGGLNPYALPPRTFAADSWFPLVSPVWRDLPTGYGPTWLLLSSAVDLIGDHGAGASDVVTTILTFRVLFTVAVLGSVVLLWAILGEVAPDRRVTGTLALAWCPAVVVVWLDHNDAVMLVLALLGIWLHLRRQVALAVVALTLSALVKYFTVPLLGVYLIWLWQRSEERVTRRIVPIAAVAVTGALVVAPFDPLGLVTRFPSYLLASGRVDRVAELPFEVVLGLLVVLAIWAARVGRSQRVAPVLEVGTFALLLYLAVFSRDWFPWYLVTAVGLTALLGSWWLDAAAVASVVWLIGLHGAEAYVVALLEGALSADRTKSVAALFFVPSLAFVATHALWRWRFWTRRSLVVLGLVVVGAMTVVIEYPLVAHLDAAPPQADLAGGRAPGPVVVGSALEWDDWSWGVTVDESPTIDGPEGYRTVCVSASRVDGAFYAHHPGFSTHGYATVDFELGPPGTVPSSLSLSLRGSDGRDLGSARLDGYSQPDPSDSGWQQIRVPLVAISAADRTVTGFVVQGVTNSSGQAYCLRDVAFR